MSTSEEIQHTIKRSTTFWHHDGNIVLQCESTQFRVHQSLLDKHFPIFADGSAFSKESEPVDNCPVVIVAGDLTVDWENILMIIYSPFMTYSSTTEYPIPVILSTLRLGKKYEADHLRNMAMKCLKEKIPHEDGALHKATELLSTPKPPPFIEYIFDILDTALDLGAQSIVPGSCLLCINFMGLAKILYGYTRSDGSISSLSPAASKLLVAGWQSMMVSAIELTINVPMRHPLTERCKKTFAIELQYHSERYDCDLHERANLHATRTSAVVRNPANAFSLGHVLLCNVCAEPIDEDYDSGVAQLWNELPSFFGLPSWDQLQDSY